MGEEKALRNGTTGDAKIPPRDLVRIKVISMGEGGVGKSCIIKRYCEEQFVSRYISTIGVDYGVKSVDVDGVEAKVNFWDLAGHPEFFEVRNEFYKDTQGAILVYDATSRKSFEALDSWVKEMTKFSGKKRIAVTVCANKADLVEKQMVSEAEGQEWASKRGYSFAETSAQSGQNIETMFLALFSTVCAAAVALSVMLSDLSLIHI
eukprot:TRINITY_DN3824_c0_g1_i2.p1 TRINITY_DN3824_c0_g1~~TRINITY_DN3824_c0_g1_i2.p1  ORF type:complete len:206 (-),score=46.28 TRINITY_DN3824_c0_g1_i2:123-740(-)